LRAFFTVMVLFSALLSLTPLLLVYGVNRKVGLPDVFFVAGDDVFLATMGQLAMMPCLILVAKLCPEGVEASLYATFVGLINFASILSEWGGAALTWYLGVTYSDFANLGTLIQVCAATSLFPLLLVRMLPTGNILDVARQEGRVDSVFAPAAATPTVPDGPGPARDETGKRNGCSTTAFALEGRCPARITVVPP